MSFSHLNVQDMGYLGEELENNIRPLYNVQPGMDGGIRFNGISPEVDNT